MTAPYPWLGNFEEIWNMGTIWGQTNYVDYSGTFEIKPFFDESLNCGEELVDFDRMFSLNRMITQYSEAKADALGAIWDSDEKWLLDIIGKHQSIGQNDSLIRCIEGR
jgi:hypothetical protein